jgi:hypothetical protein
VQQVVKVSTGQYPQPFWISAVKRAGAKIKAGLAKPKYYLTSCKTAIRLKEYVWYR